MRDRRASSSLTVEEKGLSTWEAIVSTGLRKGPRVVAGQCVVCMAVNVGV
jgi:hypothetical protein